MAFGKHNPGGNESKVVTVVLIPHHGGSMHQWRVPYWLLWVLGLFFVGSIGTAWWILGRHIQYETAMDQVDHLRQNNMKIAEELSRGRSALVQVAKLDNQLRHLLKFKSKKSLLEHYGEGGPTEKDEEQLANLLKRQADKSVDQVSRGMDTLSQRASAQERSFDEIRRYVEAQRSVLARTPSAWPVRGWISSGFGSRFSPFSGSETFHGGIDIANDTATPIRATADGTVTFAGWEGGYGKLVIVDHGNGICTLYGHCAKLEVTAGQKVRRGTVLSLMGSTGESTGPHCHYEVRVRGVAVNPLKYLNN